MIENLGTLQGLKIRTSGSAKELAVRKLGATPLQMPTPEVYEALSRGTIDGIDVSGRTYAAMGLIPGNALLGNWKVLGVIDDGASDEQHDALANLFSGKLGGPLADLAQLIGEMVGVVRAPVTTDVVEGTGSLQIGDLVDAHMQAYQGHFGKATNLQESLFATYPGAPAYISKASSYVRTTAHYGIPDLNLQGRNAVQSHFHFQS